MAILEVDLDAEEAAFEKEVAEVEAWWKTPRHAALRRPYSARRVVSLRHTQRRQYASSTQAMKLWNMLQEHLHNGTYELTFGATDPVVIGQMAKYQQTVYVSGSVCSTTRVQEPGVDLADYTWDTVPKIIDQIYHSQMWNDQRQRNLRMSRTREQRARMPYVDYMAPIIADGDMGFGGLTSTMKMAKAFVEAGVAMIHVDDLALGMKRFTIGQGRTLVPISEYESRLCAVRMQFDIMGADTMLLLRSDCIKAEFITSCIDPRDHEYIIGATAPGIEPFTTAMTRAIESGQTNPVAVRKQWAQTAGLMTFDEAVKSQADSMGSFVLYRTEVMRATTTLSLAQRREKARHFLGKDVYFDWELPRSLQGQYMYKWSVKAAIERCLAAAPFGELSWPRMDFPDEYLVKEIHRAVRLHYPNRMFGYGYTNTYDWEGNGYSLQDIKEYSSRVAKHGAVFQIQPTWAIQGFRHYADQCSEILHRDGIAGYYEEIQKPALARLRSAGDSTLELNGAFLADAFFATIGARDYS